jgi:hypothetical protein
MLDSDPLPSVDALQFRRAQPIDTPEPQAPKNCAACKQAIDDEYYQVQNHVICPSCAVKIQAGRQAQQPVPWLRVALYGAGAALAGCILYAIPLAMGLQIGIVALAVGWMVGKAIRSGSYGVGGRPQQILAVALTYFAISTSVFPAGIFFGIKHAVAAKSAAQPKVQLAKPAIAPAQVVGAILVVAAISPFLELRSSPAGGLISLFILFIGLQRAWALTARHEIMVAGPYK